MKTALNHKGALAALLVVLILEALATGLIPHSKGFLYDILQSKVGPVWVAIGIYLINYLLLYITQSVKDYAGVNLYTRMRADRTEEVIKKIYDSKDTVLVDNLEQRIQEDVKWSYRLRMDVWVEYFISGLIVIQLVIINMDEPSLVISALSYAAVSVWIAKKFNPRLTSSQRDLRKDEANFRTDLSTGLTTNLLGEANKATMVESKVRMQYRLFTNTQLSVMQVIPYLVMVPSLMSGDVTLGTLVKYQSSFALLVINAGILIVLYDTYTKGQASEQRVKEIEEKL